MNVKDIFLTSFVSLFGQAIGNSNPVTFEFCEDAVVEEVKTEKQRVKLTSYYTPILYARRSPTGKYTHRINVYKRGKTFPIYVANSTALYVEGFCRIELPTETFYINEKWEYFDYPTNCSGKPLRKGQAASRYYKKGSKFVFRGDTITIYRLFKF